MEGENSMDWQTRKYISELTQRVIDAYSIETPISDIEDIVKKLGGTIENRVDFDDFCEGTIRKSGENSFIIALSPFQMEKRKVFTIAHELGHLFLHMGFMIDKELWEKQNQKIYTRFGASEQEYQANEFAAALLMPEKVYKEVMDLNSEENGINMSKVAKYFNVSVSAAINRGKFLGYLA